MNPETLAEWRKDAEALIEANTDGTHVWAAGRIVALSDALEAMTNEARLSRDAADRAVRSRFARHELLRALQAADAPEDSMATDDDSLRYEGRAEAVAIMRDMLGLVSDTCRAPGYNGVHVAVGAGAVGMPPYVCHGCGGVFTPESV